MGASTKKSANASAEELSELQVADFGTRRRFSFRVQEEVVNVLKHDFPGRFVGTSNVHLAREFDLKPIGTMARDVRAGYDRARAVSKSVRGVLPVGEAWNRAMETGVAEINAPRLDYQAPSGVLREGLAMARAGQMDAVREMAGELAVWFAKHTQSLDAALALHMRREPAGGGAPRHARGGGTTAHAHL